MGRFSSDMHSKVSCVEGYSGITSGPNLLIILATPGGDNNSPDSTEETPHKTSRRTGSGVVCDAAAV